MRDVTEIIRDRKQVQELTQARRLEPVDVPSIIRTIDDPSYNEISEDEEILSSHPGSNTNFGKLYNTKILDFEEIIRREAEDRGLMEKANAYARGELQFDRENKICTYAIQFYNFSKTYK